MPDEQPIPSQGAEAAPDTAAPEPVSDEPASQGSSHHWWDRLLNKRTPAAETTDEGGESSQPTEASQRLTLTQEELERRIQSETDRREAQRAQRQRAEERKRLRDEDPFAYAEQDRRAEQEADQSAGIQGFFANVGSQHDRVAIDPLMEALPAAERERIMKIEGAGQGLNGRKVVVDAALKALEKQWKAEGARDAEARLRRNDAFRKQVLASARGGFEEPDLLPAASGSAADQKVSEILRGYYGVGGARHSSAS